MRDQVMERAAEIGREVGAAAASWCDDFCDWSSEDLETLLEDADPEIMDRFTAPNLSGEWADDPTPATLADEIGIRRDSRVLDDACTAWEDAVSDAFWSAVTDAAARERASRLDRCAECGETLSACECDMAELED